MKRQPKGSRNGGQFAPDTDGKNGPTPILERPELLSDILEEEASEQKADPIKTVLNAENAKAERMSWVDPDNPGRVNYESSFMAQAGAVRPAGPALPIRTTEPEAYAQAADPEVLASWVDSPRATQRARAAIYGQDYLSDSQRDALATDENYMVRFAYASSMPKEPEDPWRTRLILDSEITVAYAALKKTASFGPDWKPDGSIERATVESFAVSSWFPARMVAAKFSDNPRTIIRLVGDSEYMVQSMAKDNPVLTQLSGANRVRLALTKYWREIREGLPV